MVPVLFVVEEEPAERALAQPAVFRVDPWDQALPVAKAVVQAHTKVVNGKTIFVHTYSTKKQALKKQYPKPAAIHTGETLQANLGGPLAGKHLAGMELSHSELAGETLHGTNFGGATLHHAQWGKIQAEGARFHAATGKKAWFRGSNLAKAQFSGADFEGADFESCKLQEADFSQANLDGANFYYAKAEGASFFGADLTGIRFPKASAPGADFSQAQGQHANFLSTKLKGAKFEQANLIQANFKKADLSQADFFGATLTEAKLEGATLLGTHFEGAHLEQAHFGDGAELFGVLFASAAMEQVHLPGAQISDTTFHKAAVVGTDFRGGHLEKCRFTEASLDGCKLNGATLKECSFADGALLATRFQEATLSHLDLKGAGIGGSDFTGASLAHCDFSQAHSVQDNTFDEAKLEHCSFAGRKLRGCSFKNATFYDGCTFKGADLRGVDFTGAKGLSWMPGQFAGALLDESTQLPEGFQPEGAVWAGKGPAPAGMQSARDLVHAAITDPQVQEPQTASDVAEMTGLPKELVADHLHALHKDGVLEHHPHLSHTPEIGYTPKKDVKQAVLEALQQAGKEGLPAITIPEEAHVPWDDALDALQELQGEGAAVHAKVPDGSKWHWYAKGNEPEHAEPEQSGDPKSKVLDALQEAHSEEPGEAFSAGALALSAGVSEAEAEAALEALQAEGLVDSLYEAGFGTVWELKGQPGKEPEKQALSADAEHVLTLLQHPDVEAYGGAADSYLYHMSDLDQAAYQKAVEELQAAGLLSAVKLQSGFDGWKLEGGPSAAEAKAEEPAQADTKPAYDLSSKDAAKASILQMLEKHGGTFSGGSFQGELGYVAAENQQAADHVGIGLSELMAEGKVQGKPGKDGGSWSWSLTGAGKKSEAAPAAAPAEAAELTPQQQQALNLLQEGGQATAHYLAKKLGFTVTADVTAVLSPLLEQGLVVKQATTYGLALPAEQVADLQAKLPGLLSGNKGKWLSDLGDELGIDHKTHGLAFSQQVVKPLLDSGAIGKFQNGKLKKGSAAGASGKSAKSSAKPSVEAAPPAGPALVFPQLPPVTAEAAAGLPGGDTLQLSSLKKVGTKPGGNLQGGVYEDADGKRYLVKWHGSLPTGEAPKGLAAFSDVDHASLLGKKPQEIHSTWDPHAKRFGGVLVKEEGGQTLFLLREPKGHYDGYHWTFAKGGGQDPLETALKEVGEETGHKGQVLAPIPGNFKSGYSSSNFFLMRSTGEDPSLMDSETASTRWVPYKEAVQLISQTTNQKGKERDLQILDAAHGMLSGPTYPENRKAQNEVLAAKLYAAAGVDVPPVHLVDLGGGKLGVASEWLDGSGYNPQDAEQRQQAWAGFAADAWLANWDVAGQSHDNLLLKDGKLHRIDLGGSLLFRASGGDKGAAFGSDATEWETLLDASKQKSGTAAQLFKGITAQAKLDSAAQVAAVSDEAIQALVQAHGPGTAAEKEALATKLILRKQSLVQRALETQGLPSPFLPNLEPLPHPIAAIHASLPAVANSAVAGHPDRWAGYVKLGAVSAAEAKAAYDALPAKAFQTHGLKEKTKKLHGALPEGEKQAMVSYTGSGYDKINWSLREGSPSSGALKAIKATGKLAFDIGTGEVVHRGVSLDKIPAAEAAKLRDAIKNGVGTVLQEPAFSSTSHGTQAAFSSKPIQWHLKAAPGAKGIFAHAFSQFSGENEVLLPPNARYLICETWESGGHLHVNALLLPMDLNIL